MFEKAPGSLPNTVFIVGCGGTGSRLVPLLAQFLKTLRFVIDPKIFLFDFDNVEEKNLARQNFIRPDVGKNKAMILAERYGRAYDINIVPYTKKVDGGANFLTDFYRATNTTVLPPHPLVILCVDSAQARRDILLSFCGMNSSYAPFYIDSGNEDGYGQIILFNPEFMVSGVGLDEAVKMLPSFLPISQRVTSLPCDLTFYNDLVDLPGGSCADLDQTLAINSLMASNIMAVVQNHYYAKTFNYNRINVTVDGCTYSNILSVKNFLKLSIGTGSDLKGKTLVAWAQKLGFRMTRADDHIYNYTNAIQLELKKAEKYAADAKKKKVAATA